MSADTETATVDGPIERLRKNADALHHYLGSFDEHLREARDSLFGRHYGIEQQVGDLFMLVGRLAASIRQGLADTAEALERDVEP